MVDFKSKWLQNSVENQQEVSYFLHTFTHAGALQVKHSHRLCFSDKTLFQIILTDGLHDFGVCELYLAKPFFLKSSSSEFWTHLVIFTVCQTPWFLQSRGSAWFSADEKLGLKRRYAATE